MSRELIARELAPRALISSRRAPRAPARSCAGGARRRRARAAPPGAPASNSPCGCRSRTAGAASCRSWQQPVAMHLGEDRRGRDRLHLGVAVDDRLGRHRAARGSWLPSTSTLRGVRRRPSTARRIASSVACRMLRRSISSTLASRDAAAQRLGADLVVRGARASPRLSSFESFRPRIGCARRGSPPRPPPARPAARGRPRRRRPPGPATSPAQAELLSAARTCAIASVASRAVSRRSSRCSVVEARAAARRSAAGSSSQRERRGGQRLGRRVALQQLGHHEVAAAGCSAAPTQGW